MDFHGGKLFWSRFWVLGPAGAFFFFAFARAHPEIIRIIRFEIASFVMFTLAAIPLNMEELDRHKGIA